MLELVAGFVKELDSKCQLLLYYRAREWKPGEIARLLGMRTMEVEAGQDRDYTEAKSISNATRYCLKKLRTMLEAAGIGTGDIFGSPAGGGV